MPDITDISKLDIGFFSKAISNIVRLIPPVTFIYLYILLEEPYLFWLSVVTLFFLALEINLFSRFEPFINKSIRSKHKQKGLNVMIFLLHDPLFWIVTAVPIILSIVAFIVLLSINKDATSWIILFSCILSGFYYLTAILVYLYVAIRYKNKMNDEYTKTINSLSGIKK
jgi:small-conductance mechanosensitive channel